MIPSSFKLLLTLSFLTSPFLAIATKDMPQEGEAPPPPSASQISEEQSNQFATVAQALDTITNAQTQILETLLDTADNQVNIEKRLAELTYEQACQALHSGAESATAQLLSLKSEAEGLSGKLSHMAQLVDSLVGQLSGLDVQKKNAFNQFSFILIAMKNAENADTIATMYAEVITASIQPLAAIQKRAQDTIAHLDIELSATRTAREGAQRTQENLGQELSKLEILHNKIRKNIGLEQQAQSGIASLKNHVAWAQAETHKQLYLIRRFSAIQGAVQQWLAFTERSIVAFHE